MTDEPAINVTVRGLALAVLTIAQYVNEKHPGLADRIEQKAENAQKEGLQDQDYQFLRVLARTLKI